MLLRQTLGYNAFSTPVFAKAMINLIVNQTCFYQFMSLKVSDALLTLNSICSWKYNPKVNFWPKWLNTPPQIGWLHLPLLRCLPSVRAFSLTDQISVQCMLRPIL